MPLTSDNVHKYNENKFIIHACMGFWFRFAMNTSCPGNKINWPQNKSKQRAGMEAGWKGGVRGVVRLDLTFIEMCWVN